MGEICVHSSIIFLLFYHCCYYLHNKFFNIPIISTNFIFLHTPIEANEVSKQCSVRPNTFMQVCMETTHVILANSTRFYSMQKTIHTQLKIAKYLSSSAKTCQTKKIIYHKPWSNNIKILSRIGSCTHLSQVKPSAVIISIL